MREDQVRGAGDAGSGLLVPDGGGSALDAEV